LNYVGDAANGAYPERFERWCYSLSASFKLSLVPSEIEKELPPLDVLMVWHSYLLNPGFVISPCFSISLFQLLSRAGGMLRTANGSPYSKG
jgi:hypothetical protein